MQVTTIVGAQAAYACIKTSDVSLDVRRPARHITTLSSEPHMVAEPLNYLRQAQEDLARKWFPFARAHHPLDAQACEAVLACAQRAPKFVLPKGGRLLNDALRGLPQQPRLPFGTVVLEYQSDPDGQGIVEQVYERKPVSCPRRIVIAWEDTSNLSICVQAIFYMVTDTGGTWAFTPYFAEIACEEDGSSLASPTYNGAPVLPDLSGTNSATKHLGLRFHPTGTLAEETAPDWRGNAYLDLLDEINAVLELIEALSCSNVRHEPLPVRKLNKAAAKRGALPFDEYRVLVVSAPGKDGTDQGRSVGAMAHRSPREHLRRGHIRTYQTGRKIWVNSTLVNAGVGGRISTVRDLRRAT